MPNLVTAADWKTYAGITGSQDDAWATLMLPLVDAAIEKHCKRSFLSLASGTEAYDGGLRTIVLQRAPVGAITSVRDLLDTADDPLGAELDATAYTVELATGTLWLSIDAPPGILDDFGSPPMWGSGRRRWSVTYTAGYAAVPAPVKLAALLWLTQRWRRRDASMKSQSAGGVSQSYHETAIPPEVAELLDPFTDEAGGIA